MVTKFKLIVRYADGLTYIKEKVMNKEIYITSCIKTNSAFAIDLAPSTHAFVQPSVCLVSKIKVDEKRMALLVPNNNENMSKKTRLCKVEINKVGG